MTENLIDITGTHQLSSRQQREAVKLAAILNHRPVGDFHIRLAFRPWERGVEDQLIYYPETRRLLVYWSVSPRERLAGALPAIARHMAALQLPVLFFAQYARELAHRLSPPPDRKVAAYWTSANQGGSSWMLRKMTTPAWYDPLDIGGIAGFLNTQAPLPAGHPALQTILLGYRAYRSETEPGLCHYLPDDRLLLLEVPLALGILPALLTPSHRQTWALGAQLLSFLHLQNDPQIPAFDFAAWRAGLDARFRSVDYAKQNRILNGKREILEKGS